MLDRRRLIGSKRDSTATTTYGDNGDGGLIVVSTLGRARCVLSTLLRPTSQRMPATIMAPGVMKAKDGQFKWGTWNLYGM